MPRPRKTAQPRKRRQIRKKSTQYRPRRQQVVEQVPRESTFFAPAGEAIGGALGSYFGPAGAAVGSRLGSSAGKLISKITGVGAYHVRRNTLIDDSIPQFTSRMGDGTIRMRHKEFISDVVSSATVNAFSLVQYNICASDENTFPYLANIATNFEEFAFEGLIFEYITSSGSISATGQLGTVIGATQYNALSVPYVNKQQMEASTYAESIVPSQSCMFPIECDASQTPSNGIFYTTRPSIITSNNDKRWSNLGVFSIATVGMPNASENVGELWVSYDVLLMKPILIDDSSSQLDHWQLDSSVVPPAYFGNNPVLTPSSDNFTLTATNGTIYFRSSFNGVVAVYYDVHGSAGTWQTPLISAGVGATPLLVLQGDTLNQITTITNATASDMEQTAYFVMQSQPYPSSGLPLGYGSSLVFSAGVYPTAVVNGDLIIMQLPDDFTS